MAFTAHLSWSLRRKQKNGSGSAPVSAPHRAVLVFDVLEAFMAQLARTDSGTGTGPTGLGTAALRYSLLQLTLVCRTWNTSAMALLYANVEIDDLQRAKRFVRTLKTTDLGHLVQTLRLRATPGMRIKKFWSSLQKDDTLEIVVERCPNLTGLLLHALIPNFVVRTKPLSGELKLARLRVLDLVQSPFADIVLVAISHLRLDLTVLRELHISEYRDERSISGIWPPLPSLVVLTLTSLNITGSSLASLLSQCQTTLEKLSIGNTRVVDVDSFSWPPLRSLKKFAFVRVIPTRRDGLLSGGFDFTRFFPSLPMTLEVLELSGKGDWLDIAALPYTRLRQLKISIIDLKTVGIVRQAAPTLKHLLLSPSSRSALLQLLQPPIQTSLILQHILPVCSTLFSLSLYIFRFDRDGERIGAVVEQMFSLQTLKLQMSNLKVASTETDALLFLERLPPKLGILILHGRMEEHLFNRVLSLIESLPPEKHRSLKELRASISGIPETLQPEKALCGACGIRGIRVELSIEDVVTKRRR